MLSPFSSHKISPQAVSKKIIASVVVIVISFASGFGGALLAIYNPPPFVAGKLGTVRVNPPSSQQTAGSENNGSGSKTIYVAQTSQEDEIISVIKQNSPSVVSVIATKDVPVITNPFFSDPFFQQFFPQVQPQQGQQQQTQKQQVSAGTGFVVSQDGLIVTNKHVVADTEATYTVVTLDGKTHDATVLARDPFQDLAVLRASDVHLPPLKLGDSDGLAQGQTVIAIGNALGQFQNTVSVGVVSGLRRTITAGGGGTNETLQQVIQTDAAINPGNSGGPLLNLAGQVVGINVATAENAQNIGFAIPINTAKKDIDQIRSKGKISYPFLGVRSMSITPDIQQQNNLSVDYGALVVRGQNPGELAVTPGSPADKAGIVENDIILEIDGQKITSDNTITDIVGTHNVGDIITLLVLHKGAQETLRVTLTEKP